METPARPGMGDTGAVVRLGRLDHLPHTAPAPTPEVRLRHGAAHLHALGPRAVAEFLVEVASAHGIDGDMLARLHTWHTLHPATLAAVTARCCGGRDFPPALAAVPR